MLPDRLLSYDRTDDDRILPRWLGARDEVWLRELAAEAAAAAGRPTGEVDERVVDVVAPRARAHGAGRRVVEGVWFVERRRWKTCVDCPVPPERIRRVLFDLAAERSAVEALVTASAELGLPENVLREKLFADRQHLRTLVAPSQLPSPADLAARYNLALVQSFAVRSAELVAVVREHARRVVGHAKLLGLMVVCGEDAAGALSIQLSGPLALFHDTLKYGRALASWFPALVATTGWSLSSRVLLRRETLRLDLDGCAPVARTHTLPRAFDSKLEAALDRDLRRLASPWRVERESAVIRTERQLFYPDFALVSGVDRVLVELVGFWTPEYLAAKARMLDAARGSPVPLVMCVDERHGRGSFKARPDVLFFDRRIDAAALIAACERVVGGQSSPPSAAALHATRPTRHYLIVPDISGYATYAVRAGAQRDRWRQDVAEDLNVVGHLRIAPSRIESEATDRARLVGERFALEVGQDRLRKDAFFAYRIESARAKEAAIDVPASLSIHVPGQDVSVLPAADPVTALLALRGRPGAPRR
jgi:predicted nuclease of restriction endonuclease-like RecB superfamily